MINSVVLVGRLTRDPELRYTPSGGNAVVNFTLAVNRPFTNQQGEREADFVRIVAWRKLAENCANFLGKGRLAAVTGRLQVRSYEADDGQRRTIAEVVADNVQFLDKKDSQNKGDSYEDFMGGEVSEDDVPF
ncbi:single-stranded DNA-binding protein [Candidatus Contubernalis alkaliaceticus]|uniref:single-stranded DNA-binding protein n=1 Tax=Candidatus Contubernalis alkaliaceticus TaxID=338645 RepID=UPI001F4BD584|nr:single-stranded DNA-binding protein [Candidatus Contubernalis alkalaceticus]UNC93712.1 single-stranded DNA-binding protein [Candidatus Contubernalis alkalaceticus]